MLKQLGVPEGPQWKAALLGVDLGHSLTRLSGSTFRLCMERKALQVFNHLACDAKTQRRCFPSVWNMNTCVFMDFG